MQSDAAIMMDHAKIRQVVENWAVWRDSGDWDRLATVWHPQGRMVTTWGDSTGAEFVQRSRRAFEAGVRVLHMLTGTSIDVAGDRAVAQTKMQIIQRGQLEDVEVDVICSGRFCDAMEVHDGRWSIRLRQPIYELDHIAPVRPGDPIALDSEMLALFPEGYKHLAYLQTKMGLTVAKDLPGTRGAAADGLRARMARWLAGDDPACLATATVAAD